MITALLICFFAFTALSAICSGSETGIYKMSKVSLRISAEHGSKPSTILNRMLEDTNGLIFSILISNNVFNFAATTTATSILAIYYENNAEYYATVAATPILFVFAEVIPKNIFFIRADALMHIVTLPLWAMHKILRLCGLTPLLKVISHQFSKLFHTPESRRSITNIRTIIGIINEETKHEGLLSKTQNEIMSRMVRLSNKKIKSVMMPLEQTIAADINATKKQLIDILKKHPYTRILIYQSEKQNVIGYINIYKAIHSSDENWHIRNIVKPLRKMDDKTTIFEAMELMNSENLRIAVVADKTKSLGIITIKDLAEEMTGELMVC